MKVLCIAVNPFEEDYSLENYSDEMLAETVDILVKPYEDRGYSVEEKGLYKSSRHTYIQSLIQEEDGEEIFGQLELVTITSGKMITLTLISPYTGILITDRVMMQRIANSLILTGN